MKIKLLWLGLIIFLIPSTSAFSFDTITPEQAYELATTETNTYILDVRTEAEWKWVGHPGVDGYGEGADLIGKVINISYSIERGGQLVPNNNFLQDVNEVFGDTSGVTLITMCKTGGRGAAAAGVLEANGYSVFNMQFAFEGPPDAGGYRTINGWKVKGLPYTFTGPGYQD